MSNPTLKRTAATAIEILETQGWIQGSAHTSEGYCLLGAIDAAFKYQVELGLIRLDWSYGRQHDLYNYLKDKLQSTLAKWNDKRGRTKEEVIELLRSV